MDDETIKKKGIKLLKGVHHASRRSHEEKARLFASVGAYLARKGLI